MISIFKKIKVKNRKNSQKTSLNSQDSGFSFNRKNHAARVNPRATSKSNDGD
jgi:hypothetical protein